MHNDIAWVAYESRFPLRLSLTMVRLTVWDVFKYHCTCIMDVVVLVYIPCYENVITMQSIYFQNVENRVKVKVGCLKKDGRSISHTMVYCLLVMLQD